jgi:hypothetical protein
MESQEVLSIDKSLRSFNSIDEDSVAELDVIAERIADVLNQKLNGRRDFAVFLIYEQLEAASQGDEQSIQFVIDSGVPEWKFDGAMEEAEHLNDQLFSDIRMQFFNLALRVDDHDLRVRLSLAVIDNLMRSHLLGRYGSLSDERPGQLSLLELEIDSNQTQDGLFVFLFTGLNAAFSSIPLHTIPESHDKNLFIMSFAYAGRTLSAGMFAQGLVDSDFFKASYAKFVEWQQRTEHTVEFQEEASDIALEFIQQYDSRLTKEIVGILVSVAINPSTIDHTNFGNEYSYEEIIRILQKNLAETKGLHENDDPIQESVPSDAEKPKAELITVCAVNGASRSAPIKIYKKDSDLDLPDQIVLRIDKSTDKSGNEKLNISNANYGLIASHDLESLTQAIKGFRRRKDGVELIIAQRYVSPSIEELEKIEPY